MQALPSCDSAVFMVVVTTCRGWELYKWAGVKGDFEKVHEGEIRVLENNFT